MSVVTKIRNTTEKPPPTVVVTCERQSSDPIDGPKQMGVFEGGHVWLTPAIISKDITIAHVHFEPCARTNWHKHEGGQLLKVTAGSGWICDQGEKPRRILTGDIIWSPPGCIHWHGADDNSFMAHEATSFGGLDWYDPVTQEEYSLKGGCAP